MKIYFNSIKNPFIKSKISKLFDYALKDKLNELKLNENDYNFEVDINYISGEDIQELNRNYRKVDRETDVLSFPMIDFNTEKITQNYNMLGDIVICKKIAKLQAKKYRHSVQREICFLSLHGFLHLLGY